MSDTEVVSYAVDFRDPWDLEEVYAALHEFAKAYTFDLANEEYLVHITTGTHVAQICLYLLTESNYLPAKLLQTSPSSGKKKDNDVSGEYRIIDLDLSKYDRLAMRFRQEKETQSDFQLICGTNRDLQINATNSCFREDLLSRINLWTFHMPGLAERPEDFCGIQEKQTKIQRF